MAHFTLFSFLNLVLVSQVLGRIHRYEPDEYARDEPEMEVAKKRNSFAMASIDEAQYLPDAEFMRKVLKGIALDLATLRKTVKKTVGSLERLSEKSGLPNLGSSSEENPSQNIFPFGAGKIPPSTGSVYTFPLNPSQLNSANWAENMGNLVDNGVLTSALQSSSHQNPSFVLPQTGTYQQLLGGMNGAQQLSGNIGQLPNENLSFQRG